MVLSAENYYSKEANKEYMSVSQFKDFAGTIGKLGCEFSAMEKIEERYEEKATDALLIGSYVDSYFEGSLDLFKMNHPEIFKRDGTLQAKFEKANSIIERAERDEFFMDFMSGEKQKIMEAELFGCKWKIKMDSYSEGIAITDLKVMSSLSKAEWVKDFGYIDWVRFWGYDIQGAIYQKVVELNTGKKLPFYIAGLSKENEPDIRIIKVAQVYLDEALKVVEAQMPRILRVKYDSEIPDRCDKCDCCKRNRILTKAIDLSELIPQF